MQHSSNQAIALEAAVDYLNSISMEQVHAIFLQPYFCKPLQSNQSLIDIGAGLFTDYNSISKHIS